MMLAAIRDDAPVVFFEHRWLYLTEGEVPEEPYEVALGQARIARPGRDLTIVASSYMVPESVRACEVLAELGIEGEVIDLRGIVPLDTETILRSLRKTGALIVADTGTVDFGISAEIVSRAAEQAHGDLKKPPRRIGLPFCPSPTSPSLAEPYFPRSWHIVRSAADMFGIDPGRVPPEQAGASPWHDTPHADYMGPY
jgi:pyruvate dehydrogenase E1 component beta subunit